MKLSLHDMILIAIFAALTAVGAFIKIPTPLVPYTLQFLFCAYAGILLGARKGLYSQGLYIGLGLIGVPVFVNGGGLTYILQPTFGYLLGFAFCAYIIGKLTENAAGKLTFSRLLLSVLLGLFSVYLVGVPYLYAIVKLYLGKEMVLAEAIAVGFTPYIFPDILLSVIIAYTGIKLVPILRKINRAG
ncbi:putative membrane protein [Propionispora sp. 2/2-37]|uniref:biotin transporter BioY n=1 Tax=Propionispora sp. 2/2-37 TaxID=1677858 RepID=UPI0006BB881C|nr:biotin transporter BioY [Propionispora sp. 2/2-37]CUH95058.1 putative membrane protein [Propionispora sp. 2/2-37]